MAIVTVMNQKGGVGKTTWSVNVAHALAAKGQKVLLVDADPDAGATTVTGAELRGGVGGMVDMANVMLAGMDLGAVTVELDVWRFSLAPSSTRLRARELRWELGAVYRLREALGSVEYDWVIIDAPPGVGVMLTSALVASRWAIGVTDADFVGIAALGRSLLGDRETPSLIADARKANAELEVGGVALNAADHTTLATNAARELETAFDGKFWLPPIPRYQALREARSRAVPVTELPGAGARRLALAFADHADHLLALGGH